MAKKFYVVWVGRQTGIFTNWTDAQRQVDQFPGCKFKSFKTRQEADSAFAAGWSNSRERGAKKTGSSADKKIPTTRKVGKPIAAANPVRQSTKRYDVEVYCDGACEPNPGESGSGIAVYRDGTLTGNVAGRPLVFDRAR